MLGDGRRRNFECKSNRIHFGLIFMFIFILVTRYSGGARHSCISMGSAVDASALQHRASRKHHRCNHSDGVHCLSIVECIWDKRPLKMIFEWLAMRSAELSSRECTPWKNTFEIFIAAMQPFDFPV